MAADTPLGERRGVRQGREREALLHEALERLAANVDRLHPGVLGLSGQGADELLVHAMRQAKGALLDRRPEPSESPRREEAVRAGKKLGWMLQCRDVTEVRLVRLAEGTAYGLLVLFTRAPLQASQQPPRSIDGVPVAWAVIDGQDNGPDLGRAWPGPVAPEPEAAPQPRPGRLACAVFSGAASRVRDEVARFSEGKEGDILTVETVNHPAGCADACVWYWERPTA